MADFFDELRDEEKKEDHTEDLGILSELCEAMLAKDKEVKELEEQLKKKKEEYRVISQDLIPDLMVDKLKLAQITLQNGRKISVKDDLAVSIKPDQRESFVTWMIRQGYQSLIKNYVQVQFPKDGRQSSRRFVKYLKRYYADRDKCSFLEKEDIHSQTLKAWIKTMKAEGKKFPEECLNLYEYKIAKVK